MKVVQHMLRHSSITVTMDLYTNVLTEVAVAAAEAVAGIIPRRPVHPSRTLGLASGSQETTMDTQNAEEMTSENTKPQATIVSDLGFGSAPSGTRTPNPLVKSQLLCQLS